jgi:hypothetical protein
LIYGRCAPHFIKTENNEIITKIFKDEKSKKIKNNTIELSSNISKEKLENLVQSNFREYKLKWVSLKNNTTVLVLAKNAFNVYQILLFDNNPKKIKWGAGFGATINLIWPVLGLFTGILPFLLILFILKLTVMKKREKIFYEKIIKVMDNYN